MLAVGFSFTTDHLAHALVWLVGLDLGHLGDVLVVAIAVLWAACAQPGPGARDASIGRPFARATPAHAGF